MNFAALGPIIAPLVLEVWNQVLYPELQKLEGQVAQADLKVVADALLAAVNAIAGAEIPKI